MACRMTLMRPALAGAITSIMTGHAYEQSLSWPNKRPFRMQDSLRQRGQAVGQGQCGVTAR